ncbi:hypothetical protein BD414DRAFT_527870 [Trametes punicea]|nr:hypothetical protein BD414DRAFT_527870 [Trametes punicea]
MKTLKQTRLSFAPPPKDEGPPTRSRNESISASCPEESSSQTSKPRKGVQLTRRSRRSAFECVVIPPPPKRSSRIRMQPVSSSTNGASPKPSARPPISSAIDARKPSLKRKLSPGPDSDCENTTDVAHRSRLTKSTLLSKTKKKAASASSPPRKIRLSYSESELTPLPSSSVSGHDSDELVPTSQSDEQELTLPRIPERDPVAVKENIAQWQKEAHANPPSRVHSPPPLDSIGSSFDVEDISMDIESGRSEPSKERNVSSLPSPHTPRSSSDGNTKQIPPGAALGTATRQSAMAPGSQTETPRRNCVAAASTTSPSDAFSSLTPPPSSDPISVSESYEEPRVVQALDVKSKTEQLIADIKARAYAAAHSSPEQSSLDLDAFSDSDSDSDIADHGDLCGGLMAALNKGKEGKGKAKLIEAPSTASTSKSDPASARRYNLRRLSPKTAKPALVAPTQQRKPRKTDPLDVLLRQKEREERTGTGMAAIRSAEAAYAASMAKDGLKEEMADEEDSESEEDRRADIAAFGAAVRGTKKRMSPRTPSRGKAWKSRRDSDEEELAGIDCEAILGSKGGKAVGMILESDMRDKKAQELAKLNEEPTGVPFWVVDSVDCGAEAMDVESSLPPVPEQAGRSPVLQLLSAAVASKDITQITVLLASGFAASLRPDEYQLVIPWLFDIAFSDSCSSLSRLAYTQLMCLSTLLGDAPSGLCSSSLLSILVRLGAPVAVLENYGWTISPGKASKFPADSQWREEMIYRVVSLVGSLARAGMGTELIDCFLMMLLIGMDPTTPEALMTEVRICCDHIALAIEAAQGNSLNLEASLCEKVVAFGKTLSPLNQERLISLFPCTSRSTTRLARNVARSLLTDAPASTRSYEKLPDLSPIVDLLSPSAGSEEYFDIPGNTNHEGYFHALTCRVFLLSRVLSDIDEYTMLEIEAAKEHATREKERLAKERAKGRQDTKAVEKEAEERLSNLERIRMQLDELHGKISDTKAAHLDRSRAKAAIQQLSLRVHYQRMATLKSGTGTGKPRTLHGYFSGLTNKS